MTFPLKSWIFLFSFLALAARGEVRLPAIFSDHMVLQMSGSVPVWGWASPGEDVTVSLAGVSAKAVTDPSGRWEAVLSTKDVGPGPHEMVVQGTNRLAVSDVLVGEVWVCAGQSNMEMRLSTTGAKDVIAETNVPQLRHFKVEKKASASPEKDCVGKWVKAVPATVGEFTAVGFFFGRALEKELKGPVGLINLSWGGSLAEAWMSPEVLAADPEFAQRVKTLQADPAGKPQAPNKTPSHLYHGMMSPVLPYAIAGAVWYQGESNAGSGLAPLYRKLMTAMHGDWRARWRSGDIPLYVCQLANYQVKQANPGFVSTWAELREAQTQFGESPGAGQAVLIDVGEEATVHPRNKKDPGERLARIALAKDYGRDVVWSGPVFRSMAIEGGAVRVTFDHAHGGLKASPLPASYAPLTGKPEAVVPLVRYSPGSELEGFAICGPDRKWVWADAKIDGDSVIVRSPSIPQPVAVRYAWANNPTCNLVNGEGLPAGPFRTDNFPMTVLRPATQPPAE